MGSFEEFRLDICKVKGPKKMKVTNSYGVYDAYKHIRRNNWYNIGRPLKEKEFYAIIRGVNNILAKELTLGGSISFPGRMGTLELRRKEKGVSIIDGKLVNSYPVDWESTLRLWFEDIESRKNKVLLRYNTSECFQVKFCKNTAAFNNKNFYEFTLNRFIKRALRDKIKQGVIDTLW